MGTRKCSTTLVLSVRVMSAASTSGSMAASSGCAWAIRSHALRSSLHSVAPAGLG